MLSERLANAVIVLVCSVWAVNFGARFIVPDYAPQESINAIFMAIVGGTFALKAKGGGPPKPPGGRHGA